MAAKASLRAGTMPPMIEPTQQEFPHDQPPKMVLLVDGSSYLYRAFHAMPDLRAVPGDPTSPATGAIRGMINMLQKLRKDVRADYVACVFDAPGPTFRDDIYPEYKATRSPMPPDLRIADRRHPRSGAPARLEGAERARRGGRRRDRHPGLHGHRAAATRPSSPAATRT